MSAWSDHKCGAISDEEFEFLWRRECADDDRMIDDMSFLDEELEDEEDE